MTVTSMTGFGSVSFEVDGQPYRIEVRSVNHKNLRSRLHSPSEFAHAEVAVNRMVGEALGRGSVDIVVTREAGGSAEAEVVVDRSGIGRVLDTLQELARELEAPDPGLDLALRCGNFVEVREHQADPEVLEAGLVEALSRALDQLAQMRRSEGARLAADIEGRLGTLDALLDRLEKTAPMVMERYEERLRQRVADAERTMGIELDAGRLATELVVFSDRSDVTEEIVRARAHLAHLREMLGAGRSDVGKRLDFLTQELLRELNTVGSKCRDAGMADAVVDGKVEIERIREQVQNIA